MEASEGKALLERISEARTGWIQILQELSQKFVILKDDLATRTAQIQQQEASIIELRKTNSEFEQKMKTFQPVLDKLHQIADQYRKTQSDLSRVETAITPLLTLSEGSTLEYIREVAKNAIAIIQSLR